MDAVLRNTEAGANLGRELLASILRIRLIEERIAELYTEQEMRCPTHFSIGQEAVAAGVSIHLRIDDLVTSAHRSHAHYLAKGGRLKPMLAELYGKETGCARGKGGSMHLIDRSCGFLGAVPIVGATIPIGVGAAFAAKMRREPTVVVVYFGDAATETGVFHESLNFAALHKLPVVMVCENNLYSVLSPLSVRKPAEREVFELAKGHKVLTLSGDGNDAFEVYNLAGRAVDHARDGNGPVFVEFKTYRWLEHCGPLGDEHLGYRPPGELGSWKARDPLRLLTDRLIAERQIAQADVDALRAGFAAEIEEAMAFAKQSTFPDRAQLNADLFAS
ncbi:MAG: thiamine pyrophosphate-dependent dehydrogenase E1 component subunit alpha [Hyphomicrobium sp.]|uniref:thiamine pyrophosphate-dependent dehydrogenase E1 component subunit alpha n=1 Tax=Hyphomicrobium sp. TaxID=82 RepID=UPI0013241DF6|nr:thiamine pyrophosphate-dependent dehydrogenase E1 component subunit alpha [Hyphomicrobium sp.]KAB2939017.1 MAG: thiamine pyrophosphate-dependent dehydrogenase E1 component subunit alpha [Hyphomicrobium sp.]MBZ0211754.1 thiamine pyrophosphate-dependent dehydrogenase E1 component subunit alpha [Hyphomicrobium sp.]